VVKHLTNVRTHADTAIKGAPEKVGSHQELLKLYKRFLKTEEHRVKLQHRAGGRGGKICKKRAELLDIVLQNLLDQALQKVVEGGHKWRLTLVAVGGYGRSTLNPGSDIDLLFLHERSVRSLPDQTRDVIESVLHMLWDVGFKVGHSVRSIRECIQEGNADSQNKSAMIDARFITGDEALFDNFLERFWNGCIKGKEADYLESRRADLAERHGKYDHTVFLQEPNLKEGCGSLRDFHLLRWIAFVKFRSHSLRKLVEAGFLTPSAYRQTRKSMEFLLRVRSEMHYAEKPPQDILTLRLQGTVARNLKYPQKRVLRRIEAFMRDYYMHTRNLHHYATSVMQRLDLQAKEKRSGLINFLARRKSKREDFDGFYSDDGLIYSQNDDIFIEDSARMMRLFLHAQQRVLELSPEIRVLMRKNFAVVNVHFRFRKKIRESFEAILAHKGEVGRTLRQMHRVDFIGRYLPEFGALTCLVQHEFFHRYTADEHTLKTIDILDTLSDTENPTLGFYQGLFRSIEDPFILYLALILHDTGRAENVREHADASTVLAGRVAKRLGISIERRRLLLFLVDHHLTLWRTATTRNIEDPAVVREFGDIVRRKSYLDALFIMSYADSMGTNPEAWSGWKETLMRQLYHGTVEYLGDSKGFDPGREKPSEELKSEVRSKLGDTFAGDIEAHFELMPERYFRYRGAKPICRHVRLAKKVREAAVSDSEKLPLFLRWSASPEQSCSQFVICSMDRSELLAVSAGAIASQNINILSADFFLRADGIVVDMFRVCTIDLTPVEDVKIQASVNQLVNDWAKGKDVDLRSLIAQRRKDQSFKRSKLADSETEIEFPQRLYITNELSPEYTVIEIQALDRIGLLFDLLSVLVSLDVEIAHSRINTEKGAAIDTLYVSERNGQKLTERVRLAEVSHRVEDILGNGCS
jgi:[protein-PII] uridylyltransferase